MSKKSKILVAVIVLVALLIIVETIKLIFLFSTDKVISKNLNVDFEDPRETQYIKDYKIPDSGYIDNYETAASVGGAIIDQLCENAGKDIYPGEKGVSKCSVDYNEELNIWHVSKWYIRAGGASVYLDGKTGEVVYYHFYKD